MNPEACPNCLGEGDIEQGDPMCKCPYHYAQNAECGCTCGHYSLPCGFCEGTGLVWQPDEVTV